MVLNQIDVFHKETPEFNVDKHISDIYKPTPAILINVNSKLEKPEDAKKHMPGELEDSPI